MLNPKDHPNASVAVIAGAVAREAVWLLSHYGIAVPARIEEDWIIVVIAVLLYLGRRQRVTHRATRPAAKPVKTSPKGTTP